MSYLKKLIAIVETNHKTDFNSFTNEEKLIAENTNLLVAILYEMCKVKLVLKSKDENKLNSINTKAIDSVIKIAVAVSDKFIDRKSFEAALTWLKLAALQGYTRAQNLLRQNGYSW